MLLVRLLSRYANFHVRGSHSGNADKISYFSETALVKLENGTGLQHFRFEGFDDFSRWTIRGAIEFYQEPVSS